MYAREKDEMKFVTEKQKKQILKEMKKFSVPLLQRKFKMTADAAKKLIDSRK